MKILWYFLILKSTTWIMFWAVYLLFSEPHSDISSSTNSPWLYSRRKHLRQLHQDQVSTQKSKALSSSQPHPSQVITSLRKKRLEEGWRYLYLLLSVPCPDNFLFEFSTFFCLSHLTFVSWVLQELNFFVANFVHLPQNGRTISPCLYPPCANSSMEFCDPEMTLTYMLEFLCCRRTISAKKFEVVIFI